MDCSNSKAETGSFREQPVDGGSAVGDEFPWEESCSVDLDEAWSSALNF